MQNTYNYNGESQHQSLESKEPEKKSTKILIMSN